MAAPSYASASDVSRNIDDLWALIYQLRSSASGAGGASSYVFRPGGSPGNGVYTTPAALRAAMTGDSALNKIVSVDYSLGVASLDNGPWPDNITWQSGVGSVLATLTLAEGCTFGGKTYRFRNLTVQPAGTATPVMTIAAGVDRSVTAV